MNRFRGISKWNSRTRVLVRLRHLEMRFLERHYSFRRCCWWLVCKSIDREFDEHRMYWGSIRTVPLRRLKLLAHSLANSICCNWSSPTGTCVALAQMSPCHALFLVDKYLWTRISAAWSTGYEKRPSFSLPFSQESNGNAFCPRASLL